MPQLVTERLKALRQDISEIAATLRSSKSKLRTQLATRGGTIVPKIEGHSGGTRLTDWVEETVNGSRLGADNHRGLEWGKGARHGETSQPHC